MSAEWWRNAVIYQIYPRSFQDSDGDGVGDLKGIVTRLPHVASLGVDAIWLSPIFTSPMKDMGYDVSDYCDIDPIFGNLADFDALVEEAHRLGLKVIIDQVLSHSSDQHEWFKESRKDRTNPKADWYVWAAPQPDGSPPNNWPSVFGGPAWEWEPRRRQYYLHNFLIEQPDLNLHNPEVQDALLDTMKFWLDRGVDGFRLDTVNYYFHDPELRNNPAIDPEKAATMTDVYGMQVHQFTKNRPENIAFLKRMRALTDQYDDRMMVGEVGDSGQKAIEIMAEYTKGTDRLHLCYSFEMLSADFGAGHFRRNIENFQAGAPDGCPCWSLSNHDVPRHVTRWGKFANDSDDLARQSIAMLMSFEGAVGIYQGEELGQLETEMEYHELTDPPGIRFWPEHKGRDGCRTPMVWEADAKNAGFSSGKPWLPVKEPQASRAVDKQSAGNDTVLSAYRETIAFRQASDALSRGKTQFLDLPEPLLGFHRRTENQTVTCVFNLSTDTKSISLDRNARLMGPSRASLAGETLSLEANGFAFLDCDDPAGVHLNPIE